MLFLAVKFAGCLLTLVGQPVLARISPFAGPILRKAQQLPGFPQALQNQSNFVPVGSGPIDLSESPVMDVFAPEGGLWRTRVLDYWNGRGWTAREVEEQASDYEDWGVEETAEDLLYRDFRRALKARAMVHADPDRADGD